MITRCADRTNAYGLGASTLVILVKVRKLQNVLYSSFLLFRHRYQVYVVIATATAAAEVAVAAVATRALVAAAS